MSRPQDHVKAVQKLLLTGGLNPHHIELAMRHAEEWVNSTPPSTGGERGGTSTVPEIEEGQEVRRVERLAAKALEEIPALAKLLDDTARQLHDYVQRMTSTVKKFEDREAHCANHRVYGFDSEPVGEKHGGVNLSLCRRCYLFEQDEGFAPPKRILETWAAGRRLTQHIVDECRPRRLAS